MKKKTYRAFSYVCAVAVFLSACALKSDSSAPLPVQTVAEREAALRAFTPWRAQGSIVVDSVEEGKLNASFAWDVSPQGFDIKLFGPLGVQLVHVSQNENGAQITSRDGEIRGRDVDRLLASLIGTEVPLAQMQVWAVGLPGDASELVRDELGRLDSMAVTDGSARWNVTYERYTIHEQMYLPRMVLIEGEEVTVALSFRKWRRNQVEANEVDEVPGENEQSPGDGRLSIPGVSS